VAIQYLVHECNTKSAPNASGFCNAGLRKVLSTTLTAPSLTREPDFRNIHDAQQWVARTFHQHQLWFLRQRRFNACSSF
jgi:hypothetical protein